MTDPKLAKLREILLNEFSEDELRSLCANIEIDYDKLAGAGTFGKTRALLDTVKSQDTQRKLMARVRELRPEAYEAAGFGTDAESIAPATLHSTIPPTADSPRRASIWMWLTLALIILLCTISGVTLLLPRLLPGSSSPEAAVIAAASTSTPSTSALPTETPPAIVDVTDAMDKGAGVLSGTVPSPEGAISMTPSPAPTSSESTAGGTATVPALVITVTATPTPADASAQITSTAAATDSQASLTVIRELNDQLPKFYTGEVDAKAIQQFWTGEALRSVLGFGTVRLPKALRIQPDQRNTIQTSYRYLRDPFLVRETRDGAIVSSREYWKYATSANATEFCETRDYVYNLLRIDGQYKVNEFTSRLVDSGCP